MESECFVDQSEDKEREDAVKTDGAKSDASSEHEVSDFFNQSLFLSKHSSCFMKIRWPSNNFSRATA